MNNFSSTTNSPGLLKNDYGNTEVSEALRRRRKKLTDNLITDTKAEVESSEDDSR